MTRASQPSEHGVSRAPIGFRRRGRRYRRCQCRIRPGDQRRERHAHRRCPASDKRQQQAPASSSRGRQPPAAPSTNCRRRGQPTIRSFSADSPNWASPMSDIDAPVRWSSTRAPRCSTPSKRASASERLGRRMSARSHGSTMNERANCGRRSRRASPDYTSVAEHGSTDGCCAQH